MLVTPDQYFRPSAALTAEGELTEAFEAFNDRAIVCDFCYALFKEKHFTF